MTFSDSLTFDEFLERLCKEIHCKDRLSFSIGRADGKPFDLVFNPGKGFDLELEYKALNNRKAAKAVLSAILSLRSGLERMVFWEK